MDLLVLDNPIKVVGSINRICAALAAKYADCTEGPFCESASCGFFPCRLKGVQHQEQLQGTRGPVYVSQNMGLEPNQRFL